MRLRRRDVLPVLALALVCVGLWLMPSAKTVAGEPGSAVRARVTRVDGADVKKLGLLDYGSQHLEVKVLAGAEKGRTLKANNEIRAQLDLDKHFAPGDTAVVVIPPGGVKDGETVVARDHWRLGWAGLLFGAFCVLLCVFGGWTGAKALFSFLFSCLVVWKLVVPLALAGWSARAVSFVAVCVLTAVIMYLVAGPTRKGVAATLGALLGVLAGLVLADLFAWLMKINGATLPFVQTLLYSGYETLDLADIFVGAMVLASSGAVMDLAMDIAAGIEEVARHNPALPRRELCLSGLRIGRSVVGTMTTTLLLAYSGGYLTLLMVFAAQGTRPLDFLNSTLVSAEVVKTLVGSFALVLVAPFTAFVGALVLAPAPQGADRSGKDG